MAIETCVSVEAGDGTRCGCNVEGMPDSKSISRPVWLPTSLWIPSCHAR
jgi:hypothetical protein